MTTPHIRRNTHWAKRWAGATVCAALIAAPTVVISPTPAQAADSVFYLSGTRNNPAPQQMIDLADIGAAFTYFGEQALQIGYAAALFPFQGATALNASVAEGLANLVAALEAAPPGDRLVLIGVSQGDIVLSLLEQALLAAGEARDVLFVRMAGPSGDTGVMGRNWGFNLPGLSFVTRPDESPFDQIVLNHEYDGLGHWPVNQLNVLAVLNAVLGTLTFHNPNSYAVDLANFPLADITTTVNSLGATTTTYLIRATGLLPLLRPLQALGVDEGLLNDWHRKLKPIIDSAYEPGRAPVLARVVQSMVRVVVNGLSRVAEGVGTVLRRIEALRTGPVRRPLSMRWGTSATRRQRAVQTMTRDRHHDRRPRWCPTLRSRVLIQYQTLIPQCRSRIRKHSAKPAVSRPPPPAHRPHRTHCQNPPPLPPMISMPTATSQAPRAYPARGKTRRALLAAATCPQATTTPRSAPPPPRV